jgi:hypothetical protein
MTSSGRSPAVAIATSALVGCFGSSTPSAPQGQTDGAAMEAATVVSDGGTDATTGDGGAPEGSTGASEGGTDGGVTSDAACAGDGGPGTFTCTGSLATARIAPGAAVLSSGAVLVAGGWNATDQTVTSAEVYDPATGTFAPTGSMTDAHLWAGWTAPWPVLPSGKVLTGGGLAASGALLASAELYDPATGAFSSTGSLGTAVIAFGLVTLPEGSVLFIGGYSAVTGAAPTPGWQYTAGTELVQSYAPTAALFSSVAPLAEQRLFGCNVVLAGTVLAIGGWVGPPATAESNIEQYDPATTEWTTVGTLDDGVTCGDGAFVLPDGQILLDGNNILDPTTWTTTPTTNTFTTTSAMFAQLATGDVLAVGGQDSTGTAIAQAQIYQAATGEWVTVGSLHETRSGGRALLLPSGDVLVVGGGNASGAALASAELYHP